MNRRILNIVIGLLAFIGSANAQTLSVASIDATAGEQRTLTVKLSDAASATALQFNLSLPANVTINESGCALGSAANNHTLRVSRMDNGNYLFVIFSMDFTKLSNGTLLTIPVIFANDAASGNGNLFTVRSSASDAVSHQHQNATFAVNVNTSDIKNIRTSGVKNGIIYNVRGQKLASPQKGINIIDGQKVLVK